MRARFYHLHIRIISSFLENPSRRLSVPFTADSAEPVFAMCKAALLKIRYLLSLSSFHRPFPSFYLSLSLSRLFSCPSSVCLSSSLFNPSSFAFRFERSVSVVLRYPPGGGGGRGDTGVLDRSLVDPDNHRPVVNGRLVLLSSRDIVEKRSLPEHRVLETRILSALSLSLSLFLSLPSSLSLAEGAPFLRCAEKRGATFSLLHRRRRRADWDRRRTCLPIRRAAPGGHASCPLGWIGW